MKKVFLCILSIIIVFCFISCGSERDAKNDFSKMEKKGYAVTKDALSFPAMIKADLGYDLTYAITAIKYNEDNIIKEVLYAFYFTNESNAKKSITYITNYSSNIIDNAIVKRSGNCVYFGTQQAIKDFGG